MDISILTQIKNWCAYQERSTAEVEQKLLKLGAEPEKITGITESLKQEGYINHQRYAALFAGSKFRLRKWGKEKIRYELGQKGIGASEIEIAFEEISQEEYLRTITLLIEKEMGKTSPEGIIRKLCSKGYEEEIIREMIENMGI